MDGHEPFLRQVVANPGDDGPRLVYADWLEERGETDRAEYIRNQYELAAIEEKNGLAGVQQAENPVCGGAGKCPECTRMRDLKARNRDLLAAHAAEWSPLPLGANGHVDWLEHDSISAAPERRNLYQYTVVFRRGFVEVAADIRGDDFVANAARLYGVLPLREASLIAWPGIEWDDDYANRIHRYRLKDGKVWRTITGRDIDAIGDGQIIAERQKRIVALLEAEYEGVKFRCEGPEARGQFANLVAGAPVRAGQMVSAGPDGRIVPTVRSGRLSAIGHATAYTTPPGAPPRDEFREGDVVLVALF